MPAYVPKTIKPQLTSSGKLILKWINQNLNPEQKNAVRRILTGQARPLPYIIYGPPGTGKTVTVVEAVLQLFLLRNDVRILIVTPSNSAADLIVQRLHHSNQIRIGDMARLNAFQRAPESIPEIVQKYRYIYVNIVTIILFSRDFYLKFIKCMMFIFVFSVSLMMKLKS